MRVAMAQINPTVGDLQGNLRLIRDAIRRGEDADAQLVVLSELCISGYPPKDLLERSAFVRQCREAVEELAAGIKNTAALVGYPEENTHSTGKPVFNSSALLHQGKVLANVRKTLLPTYDIFDENRYFEPASENTPVQFCGGKIGLTICEDIWTDRDFWPQHLYRTDPVSGLINEGAQVVLNISSSPYELGKEDRRLRILRSVVAEHRVPLIYVNQFGGNDELIFDGNSVALAADGSLLARGKAFREDFLVVDTDSR